MTVDDRKEEERLHRQLDVVARHTPLPRRAFDALRENRYRYVRIPIAILLILGGFLSILPVLGIWMLPLGLILLAIDIPPLRPRVSAALIRARRRISLWRRRKSAE